MSNAPIDSNNRPAIICASKLDGVTIVPIKADPATHGLKNDDNTTGSNNGNNNGVAMLDESSNQVWVAESSAGNGAIVEVYGDISNGKVLINSQ